MFRYIAMVWSVDSEEKNNFRMTIKWDSIQRMIIPSVLSKQSYIWLDEQRVICADK
jgi:hypothetical protein